MFIYKYIYEEWPDSFDVYLNFSLLFFIADPFYESYEMSYFPE